MRTSAAIYLLLFACINAVSGQLNYDGNPLTEDTIYTAEESHLAENRANKARAVAASPQIEDTYLLAIKTLKAERSRNNVNPPTNNNNTNNNNNSNKEVKNDAAFPARNYVSFTGSTSLSSYNTLPVEITREYSAGDVKNVLVTNTNTNTNIRGLNEETESRYPVYPLNGETPTSPKVSSNPTDSALAMFLNSQTPSESKIALEEYLGGAGEKVSQTVETSELLSQPHISDIILPQRRSSINDHYADQLQPNEIARDYRYENYVENEYPSSKLSRYLAANELIDRNLNSVQDRASPSLQIRGPSFRRSYNSYRRSTPYKNAIYRGHSRLGPVPGYRQGVGHGPGKDGLEVIYTKPPSQVKNADYFRGQNPETNAAAWFPDANYPPPDLNVRYSQLYAQSYDPRYYDYIAKYGKIKPHLYGKFDEEPKDEGMLHELFQSFKEHGLKHVMNPMFLLGFGIPMITFMLSTLMSSAGRSLARSSGGSGINGNERRITDEDIDEWTSKLQRALECYKQFDSEIERSKCAAWD